MITSQNNVWKYCAKGHEQVFSTRLEQWNLPIKNEIREKKVPIHLGVKICFIEPFNIKINHFFIVNLKQNCCNKKKTV